MEYSKILLRIFLILFLMGEGDCEDRVEGEVDREQYGKSEGLMCYESNLNASCTQTHDKTELLKCYQNLPATININKRYWYCSSLALFFDDTTVALEFGGDYCQTETAIHYQEIVGSALGKTGTFWRCGHCHENKCNVPASERKKEEEKEKTSKKKKSVKSTAQRCTSCYFMLFLVYFFIMQKI